MLVFVDSGFTGWRPRPGMTRVAATHASSKPSRTVYAAYATPLESVCQKSSSVCETSKRDSGSFGLVPLRAQNTNPPKLGAYVQFACAMALRNALTGLSVRNLQHRRVTEPGFDDDLGARDRRIPAGCRHTVH